MQIYETTVQIRVSDFDQGRQWYETLFQKPPDFAPHDGFAEWELIPGSWLQVAEGVPAEQSGPLRFGVTDIERELERVIRELQVEPVEVFSREEVPVKWATFTDKWGNRIGFFEYLDAEEKEKALKKVTVE